MNISTVGIGLIKQFEGFRARKYLCSAGMPTIGYGHVILPDERFLHTATIDEEEATSILKADLHKTENGLNTLLGNIQLNQNQYDALCCFVFNIGITAFANSTLLKRIKAGDLKGAGEEFTKWCKVTVAGEKVESIGLKNRRVREMGVFANNELS